MENESQRHPDGKGWSYEVRGYDITQEPLLRTIKHIGKEVGIITRNRYDAEVLNAKSMLCIDVDLGDPRRKDGCFVETEHEALEALRDATNNPMKWLPKYERDVWGRERNQWIDAHRQGIGFRVYRTAGGLRYICTTHAWRAGSDFENDLMRYVYADPMYRRICRIQRTFRVRLTPKPWRIRQECIEHPDRIEWRNKPGEGIARTAEYAATIGSDIVLPSFAELLRVHDSTTLALMDHGVKTYLA